MISRMATVRPAKTVKRMKMAMSPPQPAVLSPNLNTIVQRTSESSKRVKEGRRKNRAKYS